MSEPRGPRRPDYRSWRLAASLSSVGLTLALSVAIGVAIGIWLDRRFGTSFWVIIFTLVGVAAGFKQLIQAVIRAGREQDAAEAEERRRNRNTDT